MIKLLRYFLVKMAQNQARFYLLSWITFGLVLVGNSLGVAQNKPAQSPRVLATFLPVYMFSKAVVGTSGKVEILITPGTEVHEYQSTPGAVRSIALTDILVKNGLGIESFLDNLIKNAGNTKLKQIDASKGVKTIKESGNDVIGNPHVWLDPVLAQQQVSNIRDGLIAANPSSSKTYQANAANYIKQLQGLDRDFQTGLASSKGCKFIAFHNAFPYIAKRYGLQQMAVLELPEDNLKPQDIQRIMALSKKYRVKALLSEPGVDDRRLKQIANELKLPVKTLDPLENGQLDPQYYFTVMRQNLQTLQTICK
jgi:zinc transport system substrate-binding protein